MTEKEKMLAGEVYSPFDKELMDMAPSRIATGGTI